MRQESVSRFLDGVLAAWRIIGLVISNLFSLSQAAAPTGPSLTISCLFRSNLPLFPVWHCRLDVLNDQRETIALDYVNEHSCGQVAVVAGRPNCLPRLAPH